MSARDERAMEREIERLEKEVAKVEAERDDALHRLTRADAQRPTPSDGGPSRDRWPW